jgi:hypothetical protein
MITVTLTWYEESMGIHVGNLLYSLSMRDGRKDNDRDDKSTSLMHSTDSACAEIAVAKALNRYWRGGVDIFKLPDIWPDLQVRHCREDGGRLIVRPKDTESHRFVLVTGVPPLFVIRGWMVGTAAKRDEWYHDFNKKGPAWWVPQSDLHPMATFGMGEVQQLVDEEETLPWD